VDDITDKISIVQKFLNILSWKKIGQVTIFLFVVSVFWAAFENREPLYNLVSQSRIKTFAPSVHKLSKSTTDRIDKEVAGSEIVIGIQVTLVDFQRNTRIITYSSIDDSKLNDTYNTFANHAAVELPLFNNDVVNNRRLVDLVNGEFICNPYEETIAAKLVPESTKYVNTLCANGIPPFYGKFSGIVGIYLKREPNEVEKDQIRVLSKNLGLMIFYNDVK
jgi:hypothetical protein